MGEALREGKFTHQGFSQFTLEGGEGETLIFLHPLGASSEIWAENIAEFVKRYRVFATDFLGCGRSDKPDIPYDLLMFVDRMIAWMNERGVEKATFIGNSLGGHVALLMAITNPARVKRLILANPSGLHSFPKPILSGGIFLAAKGIKVLSLTPPERFLRLMMRNLYGLTPERAKKLANFYLEQMKGEGAELWKQAFVRTLQSIFNTPLDKQLSEIDRPTLVVWGKEDRLLGKGGGEALAKAIPNARLELFEKTGHFPAYERPEKFNETVESFIVRTRKKGVDSTA